MAKGQAFNYTASDLASLRHLARYTSEIEQQTVTPARRNELKQRFSDVKRIAPKVFKRAYELMIALDGESLHDPELAWESKISEIYWLKNTFSFSDEELIHPLRHFSEYISQIEAGNISSKRRKELKKRLRIIMSYSLNAFVTAQELNKELFAQ